MLIWTNFDSLAITYLMQVACFKKFHSPIEVVLNSLKTQNDSFLGRKFCITF